MIKTIKEQRKHVVSEMRSATYCMRPTLVYFYVDFKARLYDDCESSLPLESDFVVDAPLTDLEKIFDPSLTSLPFVALSSSTTPIDSTVSDLPLLASHVRLAQCTGLEMGEPFGGDGSIVEDDHLLDEKSLH